MTLPATRSGASCEAERFAPPSAGPCGRSSASTRTSTQSGSRSPADRTQAVRTVATSREPCCFGSRRPSLSSCQLTITHPNRKGYHPCLMLWSCKPKSTILSPWRPPASGSIFQEVFPQRGTSSTADCSPGTANGPLPIVSERPYRPSTLSVNPTPIPIEEEPECRASSK